MMKTGKSLYLLKIFVLLHSFVRVLNEKLWHDLSDIGVCGTLVG